MIQILFALLAGVLTILAPCILPMLPIILGASVGQTSKQRPLLIVAGFIVSFAAASLILATLIEQLHLSPNLLRYVAEALLLVFAIFMIWPKPFEILTTRLSGTINRANQIGKGSGNWGGLFLGLVLGIIWTPCAGPILGSILTLIATQGTTARSATLLIFYSIGAGLPMLIIVYGSQYITTKVRAIAQYSVPLQQTFGVLVLLLAIAMFFQYDTIITNKLTAYFPQSGLENKLVGMNNPPAADQTVNPQTGNNPVMSPSTTMNSITFQNYGSAPEFTDITNWLNLPAGSQPPTMASLNGKVVLVDFWTFSCINCIRTLPYVTKWYDTYHNQGLEVIGVHTPEFAFEKDSGNVANAIKQFNIHYPVAQDNNYGTWTAYNNEYWPAEYLIDQKGNIVDEHFGEGDYDKTENSIRQLLGLNMDPKAQTSSLGNIQSPEMYFELQRLQNLDAGQQASSAPQTYTIPANLSLNTFGLGGTWQFNTDHAQLTQSSGEIKLHFSSGKVYMVAAADHLVTLKITVDGLAQPDVVVQSSELYNLYNSSNYYEHVIDIKIPDAGLQAFTFTFG